MSISVNTVIIDLINEAQYLVLWISQDGGYGYWHNLTSASRTPSKFITVDVIADISDGKYETDIFTTQVIKAQPSKTCMNC